MPALSELSAVAGVAAPVALDQVATYYDTPDLRLLSARVTLSRRSGGVDDGWHLELPRDGDRREAVELPLGPEDGPVPERLLDLVRFQLREVGIGPVAVLRTRRSLHRLLAEDGTVLAQLCDDHVRGETGDDLSQWREWEIRLVAGKPDLLDDAGALLSAAGAQPPASPSRVARVLADRPGTRPRWRFGVELTEKATAGELLLGFASEQLARLEQQDRALRFGEPEGVHQMRVALRRLRSALATYSSMVDGHRAARLRAELKWLGGVLGVERDAQVISRRLEALVADQPDRLVIGPVADRVRHELGERSRRGRAEVDAALAGDRYLRLLDELETFLESPTVTDAGQVTARDLVPELLAAELQRLRTRHRRAQDSVDPHERELALHEVRKASKRLRYAAESAVPVLGERAARLAELAEGVQELFG